MRCIWDAPIRIFHWMLVILFAFSWWSAESSEMEWHQRSGLMLCWLASFRLLWGFLGSSTARFGRFVKGPGAIVAYLRSGEPWQGLGHNPVGGWSALILILLIALQVTTGLFAVDVDGIESGPLSHLVDFDRGRQLAGLHHLSFDLLLILAGIHILAIGYYLLIRKQNLVAPMITGKDAADGASLTAAPLWRLGISLFLSGLLTYVIANGFRF